MIRALLNRFLRLLIVANEAVVTGHRTPVGYTQISVLSPAVGIPIPTTTASANQGGSTTQVPVGYAIIQNNGTAAVRWRDDGTLPTAAVGMVLNAGAELDYVGDISRIQFIQVAAGASLDVSLYL
jgi:hypothetical protein